MFKENEMKLNCGYRRFAAVLCRIHALLTSSASVGHSPDRLHGRQQAMFQILEQIYKWPQTQKRLAYRPSSPLKG